MSRQRFRVIAHPHTQLAEGEIETMITADYFRVEGGVLTFRNYRDHANPYPEPVHVFAPGVWGEVIPE